MWRENYFFLPCIYSMDKLQKVWFRIKLNLWPWISLVYVSKQFSVLIVSRECTFLGSLSRHNKDLERRTLALGSWTNRVIALRQISVTALFYLEDSRRVRERERASVWLLLLYVFSSTWACPMQIGLSQECCLFCLKSSLWSLDLPLTFLVF